MNMNDMLTFPVESAQSCLGLVVALAEAMRVCALQLGQAEHMLAVFQS